MTPFRQETGHRKMVVLCISFGSLSWLRPGNVTDDPLRFSRHAAAFNTTGFTRNRRFWHTPGVIRMNVGPHPRSVFRPGKYESGGMEKRGEWNRVLLNLRLSDTKKPDRILLCIQSGTVGRIDFSSNWCTSDLLIVAGSAFRGEQETLILAQPGGQLKTERGNWEVTWTGLSKN